MQKVNDELENILAAAPDITDKKKKKKSTAGGEVDEELKGIKETMRLVQIVLLVGFVLFLSTIEYFVLTAYQERTTGYEQLLEKTATLEAQMQIISHGKFSQ